MLPVSLSQYVGGCCQVLDVVLSRLLVAEPRPDVLPGLRLLQRCVSLAPAAPLVLSLLLSFVSALFVFLSCACSQLCGECAPGSVLITCIGIAAAALPTLSQEPR